MTVSRDDIISGLEMFRDGDVHDKKYQARLFDTFLVAVYAYDDDLRLVFSFSGNKNTIQIPIESAVNAVENNEAECSFKLCSAPPKQSQTNQAGSPGFCSAPTVYMTGGIFVLVFPLAYAKK